MKNAFLKLFLFLSFTAAAFSQVFVPDSTISGNISVDRVLSASKTYLLTGFVYVDSLKKLTIPAGTKIFGDKATKGTLIVKRGAQIFAQGTATNPIVFTSAQPSGLRQPGDWGGILICGSATNNQSTHVKVEGGPDAFYGGSNDADNSGIMRYVRIEYGGIALLPNNETNSLTMCSVGSGTTIEYIQTSFGGDDGFEWFGGTVSCKYLVAYKNYDDEFDTDFGFRGKVQFGVGYQDPFLADQSKSEAFESDNDGSGSTNTPRTAPIFSNMTLIGPKQLSTTPTTNYNAVNHFWGIHHRRSTRQSIYNSLFAGFDEGGLYLDGTTVLGDTANFKYKHNIFAGNNRVGTTSGVSYHSWLASFANDSVAQPSNLNLKNPYNPVRPDLTPNAGSPAFGKANFADLTDPFWTSVTYAGAFASNNDRWDEGWTNYDPQSTNYNTGIAWTSTIKVINSFDETRYVVFGKGVGATNGFDASYGEAQLPPSPTDFVDAFFEFPVGLDSTSALDIRDTTSTRVTYKLKVNAGLGTSLKISWNPNSLGAGNFYLTDSLGGALFALTNMKTTPNVSFTAVSNFTYIFYIYVDGRFTSPIVPIGNGWNMVSYPGYNLVNNAPSTIWSNRDGSANVYSWGGSYVPQTNITPGKGHWMKHNGAQNYTFSNVIMVTNTPQTTTVGWNMIGVYDYDVQVSGLSTVPANVKTGLVYGWTPGSGYGVVTDMLIGKSYWVNVTAAGQAILPGRFTGIAKLFNEEIVKQDWNKIYLTDAEGRNYTLYAVDGASVNLNTYELPPFPPAGLFDVRFGSQRFVEDLSNTQTINFTGVTYPVTITAEKLNLHVSDNVGGQVINEVLRAGQPLVINNSGITSLKVSSSDLTTSNFELAQNYPNPFNPSTTIKFAVPQTSNIRLSIFNALGEKVAELVNGTLEAGTYNVTWDASKVSSGIYFYELQGDKFSSIKKMMLVK